MPDTCSFIRNLVATATDLSPGMRSNLLYCLETGKLPVYQVAGPLYVNASKAAELLGVGRTKFPEVTEFRRIQKHELAPDWFMYFTPELVVHQPKEIQASPIGLTFNPQTNATNQPVPSLDAA